MIDRAYLESQIASIEAQQKQLIAKLEQLNKESNQVAQVLTASGGAIQAFKSLLDVSDSKGEETPPLDVFSED